MVGSSRNRRLCSELLRRLAARLFAPSLVALLGFIPSIWLFNTRCYKCGYPAYADFQADERLTRDERVWTRFWGKEYGGVHLPLPDRCTKCGADFI
jgi:hypothetical protein